MRRLVAAVLLIALFGQTSGSALASTPEGLGQMSVGFGSVFALIRTDIMGSQIYAQFTGTEDAYAASHHAPPHVRHEVDGSAFSIAPHASPMPFGLQPHYRTGVRRVVTMPPLSALREYRRDPLAMRRSNVHPGPIRFGRRQQASATRQAVGRTMFHVAGVAGTANAVMTPMTATVADNGTTGINPWWTYEERPIPGIGQAMVNVGTGNLLVTATDVDVHELGIDLAFRRVYNSQSQLDVNGDDGSGRALYGNLWSNTFNADMVYDKTANTITVYDIDGTQCVYQSDGSGGWTPCLGTHATLKPTDSSDCTYAWTKKSGTIYWFHADNNGGTTCSIAQAKKGHLQEILARNNSNNITFNYSFVSGYNGAEYVTEIDAVHSDGDKLVMTFAPFPSGCTIGTSGCWNELASIKRPDGQSVTYTYDSLGNLVKVVKPGNDAASTLKETYGYNAGTSDLYWACGPRCSIGNATDGAAAYFGYDSSLRVNAWHWDGVVNFVPSDGTSTKLSAGSTGWARYFVGYFYYTATTASNNKCGFVTTTGTTTYCDGDDHSTIWTTDTSDRVTETQDFAEGSTWIPSWQWWDASNNLIKTKDANLNITQYAYDTKGNTIEVQEPAVKDYVSSPGTAFNPTSYYSYDGNNNVTAYCDPLYNKVRGKGFIASTSDSLCPTTVGSGGQPQATVYQYATPAREPFGCLSDTYTPMGYHHAIGYGGYCGSGLPTSVTGDYQGNSITQYDNSTRTPTQTFGYDGQGNLTSYSKGNGTWTLTYDSLNRLTAVTDPTGVWSYTCYNLDGSVSAKETALQHQLDSLGQTNTSCGSHADQYGHDVDGDVIKEVRHYNGAGANNPTYKWYDGFDRLVEVQLPGNMDSGLTRYIYDLTQNGGTPSLTINANGSPVTGNFPGYGNLYKTQECLGASPCTWTDVNGNAYDGIDRTITRYQYAPSTNGAAGPLGVAHSVYDSSAGLGLLDHTIDPVGNYTYFKYDGLNRVSTETFSGPDATSTLPNVSPNGTYQYDEDGHQATMQFTGPESGWADSYAYDADGRESSYTEGSGGNTSAPATVTYGYYADGMRKALSISTSGHLFSNPVFQYAYRNDGARTSLLVAGYATPFSWTYDAAGRVRTQKDPFTGMAFADGQTASGTIVEKNVTYDPTTGEMTSLKFPDGAQYSAMTHDPEGDVTGFSVSPPSGWNPPADTPPTSYVTAVQMTYDQRGQLASTSGLSPMRVSENGSTYEVVEQNKYVYGHPCDQINPNFPLGNHPRVCGVDPNTGSATTNVPFDTQTCGYQGYLSFDADGRITQNHIQETGETTNNCAAAAGEQLADTRAYDAENHTVDDNCPWNISLTVPNQCTAGNDNQYGWGPNGKLRTYTKVVSGPGIPPTGSPMTLHWDGDDLLFVTGNNGALKELFIEKLGSIATNTSGTELSVADRDFAGMAVAGHGDNGSGGIAAGGPTALPSHVLGLHPQFSDLNDYGSGASAGYWVGMARNDGYQVGGLTIQGVRAYDPGAAQWTTPDAYKGDVHDPMSQRAYLWNGNNAILYSDPSGYLIGTIDPGLVNLLVDMINRSSIFRQSFIAMALDKNFTYDFAVRLLPKGKDGMMQPEGDRAAVQIAIVPGLSRPSAEDVMAHEAGGHGWLLATEGVTKFNDDARHSNRCAQGQKYCNNNEIKAQHREDAIDAQLGIAPENSYEEALKQHEDAESSVALMGSNGLDYCFSCAWSGILQR